jgi:hypothetical protein
LQPGGKHKLKPRQNCRDQIHADTLRPAKEFFTGDQLMYSSCMEKSDKLCRLISGLAKTDLTRTKPV